MHTGNTQSSSGAVGYVPPGVGRGNVHDLTAAIESEKLCFVIDNAGVGMVRATCQFRNMTPPEALRVKAFADDRADLSDGRDLAVAGQSCDVCTCISRVGEELPSQCIICRRVLHSTCDSLFAEKVVPSELTRGLSHALVSAVHKDLAGVLIELCCQPVCAAIASHPGVCKLCRMIAAPIDVE